MIFAKIATIGEVGHTRYPLSTTDGLPAKSLIVCRSKESSDDGSLTCPHSDGHRCLAQWANAVGVLPATLRQKTMSPFFFLAGRRREGGGGSPGRRKPTSRQPPWYQYIAYPLYLPYIGPDRSVGRIAIRKHTPRTHTYTARHTLGDD